MSSRASVIAKLIGLVVCTTAAWAQAADTKAVALKSIDQVIAEAQADVPWINISQLKQRIAANPKLVVLDVRTAAEFEAAHLKGAAWVERGVAEFVMVRQLPDPQAEIVVYCKVGNRTGLAVKALEDVGYRNVVGLAGGFDEWARQGNSVYNALGEFRLIKPLPRNAASQAVDFYQDKQSLPSTQEQP